MSNPIFWIFFMAILFWSLYHKWDEKRKNFVKYPILTSLYFFVASIILVVFYPPVLDYLKFDFVGFSFVFSVFVLNFFLYKFLKEMFRGPRDSKLSFFEYYKILDDDYVIPKFTEIIFQQVFFVSVFLIAFSNFSEIVTVIFALSAFVLAHLNLFLFRKKSEALFYLIFSVMGAPLFLFFVVATGSIWVSVSLHLLFYIFLSSFAWIFSRVKY